MSELNVGAQMICRLIFESMLTLHSYPCYNVLMRVAAEASVKVADEVWIAVALLHREQPGEPDFSVEEIVARARREKR